MMANAKAKGFSDLSMEKRGIKLNGTVKIPSCLLPLLLILIRFQDETNYVTMAAWQDLVVRI